MIDARHIICIANSQHVPTICKESSWNIFCEGNAGVSFDCDSIVIVDPAKIIYEHFANGVGTRGEKAHSEWDTLYGSFRAEYPELATEIDLMQRRELPSDWDRTLPTFPADEKGMAGREASGKVLNALAQSIPWMLGGSADLGPSTKTLLGRVNTI